MIIKVLKKGDRVLNVTSEFIAVERANGEVDIIPLIKENGSFRINLDEIVTISYGDNVVENDYGNVTITTF